MSTVKNAEDRRVACAGDKVVGVEYGRVTIVADISKLKMPEFVVRSTRVDDRTLSDFVTCFEDGKYGDGGQYMTIALLGVDSKIEKEFVKTACSLSGDTDPRVEDIVLADKTLNPVKEGLVVVDGAHRKIALMKESVVRAYNGSTEHKVHLLYRRDNLCMSNAEIIAQGCTSNETAFLRVEYTAQDRVFALLSFIHAVRKDRIRGIPSSKSELKLAADHVHMVEPGKLKRDMLRLLVQGMNFRIGNDGLQSLRKYCLIAEKVFNLGKLNRDLELELLGMFPVKGVVHLLGKSIVWGGTEQEVKRRLTIFQWFDYHRFPGGWDKPPKYRLDQTEYSKALCHVQKFWELVAEFCSKKNVGHDDYLGLKCTALGTTSKVQTVEVFIEETVKARGAQKFSAFGPEQLRQLAESVIESVVEWPSTKPPTDIREEDAAEEPEKNDKSSKRTMSNSLASRTVEKRRRIEVSQEEVEDLVTFDPPVPDEQVMTNQDEKSGDTQKKIVDTPVTVPVEQVITNQDVKSGDLQTESIDTPVTGPVEHVIADQDENFGDIQTESVETPVTVPIEKDITNEDQNSGDIQTESVDTPVLETQSCNVAAGEGDHNDGADLDEDDVQSTSQMKRKTLPYVAPVMREQSRRNKTKNGARGMTPSTVCYMEPAAMETTDEDDLIPVKESKELSYFKGPPLKPDGEHWKKTSFQVDTTKEGNFAVVLLEGQASAVITHRNTKENWFCYKLVKPRPMHGVDVAEIIEEGQIVPLYKQTYFLVSRETYKISTNAMDDIELPYCKNHGSFQLLSTTIEAAQYAVRFLRDEVGTSALAKDDIVDQKTHLQAVLNVLGMRFPHRAHMCLNLDDVKMIRRHLVRRICVRDPELLSILEPFSRGVKGSLDNKASKKFKSIVRSNLKNIRMKLDDVGYVALDGFIGGISDDIKPLLSCVEDDSRSELSKKFESFFKFWEKNLPQATDLKHDDPKHKYTWSSIRQGAGQGPSGVRLNSRLTTTKYAMTKFLEDNEYGGQSEEGAEILRARCLLEVMIMQLGHWLRLDCPHFNALESGAMYDIDVAGKPPVSKEKPRIYCPDTGGRVLGTMSEATKVQVAHKDFDFPEKCPVDHEGVLKFPSYFAIVTGAEGSSLWVVDHSHKFATKSREEQGVLGRVLKMKLVFIKPWSVLLVRGDVLHAGPGGKESNGKHNLRFHMYIGREGVVLLDGISHHASFRCG